MDDGKRRVSVLGGNAWEIKDTTPRRYFADRPKERPIWPFVILILGILAVGMILGVIYS